MRYLNTKIMTTTTSFFSLPKPLTHQTQLIKQPILSFFHKSQKCYGFQSLQIGGNKSRNGHLVSSHLISYHGPHDHHLIPPPPTTNNYHRRNKSGGHVGCSHALKRKAGEDFDDDEEPPKKQQKFESRFPPLERHKSEVEPKPNVSPAIHASNVIITDVHLSLNHHPIIRTPLLEFQEKYESWLYDHLKKLSEGEQTLEVSLEMAALVNLLKLFNYSHDLEKQKLVNKASAGAQKLQEGLIQVKEGQELLQEAIVQMFQSMSV